MTSVLVAPNDAQQRGDRWRSVDLERRRLAEAATQRIRSQFRSEGRRVNAYLRENPGDVTGALELVNPQAWEQTLSRLWIANGGLYWDRTLGELFPPRKGLKQEPDDGSDLALAVAAGVAITQVAEVISEISTHVRERSAQIVESTRRRITGAAQRVALEGAELFERAVRSEISTLYSTWKAGRSAAIARHNVVAATALGQHAAASFSGAVLGREWVSMRDDRVRSTHSRADGQRVGINDTYSVGSSNLRYPGDPLGPAGETANCRCIEVYVCFINRNAKQVNTSGDCEGFDAAIPSSEPQAIADLSPEESLGGKAFFTKDQAEALNPIQRSRNKWKQGLDDRLESARQLFKGSPQESFHDWTQRWSNAKRGQTRLRNDIAEVLSGADIDTPALRRARSSLRALEHSGGKPETLYRGMSIKGKLDNVVEKFPVGERVDLGMSSFTSQRKVADDFARMSSKTGTTQVRIEWLGRGKAVPIENLSEFFEGEWVSGGSYRIVETKQYAGTVIVRVEQVSSLGLSPTSP